MMLRSLLFFSFLISFVNANAQSQFRQYFDGQDTSATNSIITVPDTADGNIWQIGRPQKTLFSSAATVPNAMTTDTLNYVPDSNVSAFTIGANLSYNGMGTGLAIVAYRWKQKLDMAKDSMGGIVEFSLDAGKTWSSIFNNPGVHNFYGYDSTANKDTLLSTGQTCFSGRDTTWRDIWLCFNVMNMSFPKPSILVRFTFRSDSVVNDYEGWMIDNMQVHNTWVHTVAHGPKVVDKVMVYPTVTNGVVNLEAMSAETQLGRVQLYNADGRHLQDYALKSRDRINISQYPSGQYYLKVEADKHVKTYKIMLAK
ncbi:MAG: T9SS type A sorting domain-containing protein [Sphingobacteriales bacterium]|nr:MAG: T9SS type A sorting domain-containing protein [Sphingobacteriales bacterium]